MVSRQNTRLTRAVRAKTPLVRLPRPAASPLRNFLRPNTAGCPCCSKQGRTRSSAARAESPESAQTCRKSGDQRMSSIAPYLPFAVPVGIGSVGWELSFVLPPLIDRGVQKPTSAVPVRKCGRLAIAVTRLTARRPVSSCAINTKSTQRVLCVLLVRSSDGRTASLPVAVRRAMRRNPSPSPPAPVPVNWMPAPTAATPHSNDARRQKRLFDAGPYRSRPSRHRRG